MKKQSIARFIALIFVTLFLYTSLSKLTNFDVSREQLALSPILAGFPAAALTIVCSAEIVCAILLFLPRTQRIGLWSALGLMALFTGYIVYIIRYNDDLPCTCGGILEALTWPQHLILNFALILLCGLSLYWTRTQTIHSNKQALQHA